MLEKFSAESSNVDRLLEQIDELSSKDVSDIDPEVRRSLAEKTDQCIASAQKALELKDLLRQNLVKVEENKLESVEGRFSALKHQLQTQVGRLLS